MENPAPAEFYYYSQKILCTPAAFSFMVSCIIFAFSAFWVVGLCRSDILLILAWFGHAFSVGHFFVYLGSPHDILEFCLVSRVTHFANI